MTPGRKYQSDALRPVAADLRRLERPLGVKLEEVIGWGGSGFVATTAVPDLVVKITVDDDECAMWTQIQARGKTDKSVRKGFPTVTRVAHLRGAGIPPKTCGILREACDPLVVKREIDGKERVVYSSRTERWIGGDSRKQDELQRCEHILLAYRSTASLVNDRRRTTQPATRSYATKRITPSGPRTGAARGLPERSGVSAPRESDESRIERMDENLDALIETPFQSVALALFALMDDDLIVADTHIGNFGWKLDSDEIVLFDPGWSPVLYYDEIETILVPNRRVLR